MGRWLGFSESYVDHKVLPALRGSSVVSTDVTKNSEGYVDGLEWELRPLTAALAEQGSALVLDKAEAATLLRFCERVFGPGWAPVDKEPTPPGLLAARRGRGAASARLALVQLALRARPDGRVRLDGGAVKSGHRRAAATIGRLLGCDVADAERVLDDLVDEGVVEFYASAQGAGAGERLVIPAVAAAYGRGPGSELSAVPDDDGDEPDGEGHGALGCTVCGASEGEASDGLELVLEGDGWVQEGFDVVDEGFSADAVGALRDQPALEAVPDCLDVPSDQGERDVAGEELEGAPGALHHASHASLVEVSGSLSLCGGFSGEADRRSGDLPEPASAREDHPGLDAAADTVSLGGGQGGPLRGEQQGQVRDELGEFAGRRCSSGTAGDTVVLVRPALLPAGLEGVLAPVCTVWERIPRAGARAHVAAAVRLQLGALRGLVGPEHAEEVLAERLERRLVELMGRPVNDPVAWLLGRALVQRQWCWSQLCDEGRRMDTGGECPSCQVVIGDRRGLRARVAAETARQMPGATAQAVTAETEKRLQAAVRSEAAAQAVRRERALAEREVRAQVIVRRKAEVAAAEEARRAAPCVDCGVPEAAGLCMACTCRRATDRVLAEAVDLAVMARADLEAPAAVAEATVRCAEDTRSLLQQALDRRRAEGADELALMLDSREIAERIRDQRRESLYGRLMRSAEAEAEADKAFDAELRSRHRHHDRVMAHQAADRAADEALLRAAEFLFTDRARRLSVARGERVARRVPAADAGSLSCAAEAVNAA